MEYRSCVDQTAVCRCSLSLISGQGLTLEEARDNLCEALELFFETAAPEEIEKIAPGSVCRVPTDRSWVSSALDDICLATC